MTGGGGANRGGKTWRRVRKRRPLGDLATRAVGLGVALAALAAPRDAACAQVALVGYFTDMEMSRWRRTPGQWQDPWVVLTDSKTPEFDGRTTSPWLAGGSEAKIDDLERDIGELKYLVRPMETDTVWSVVFEVKSKADHRNIRVSVGEQVGKEYASFALKHNDIKRRRPEPDGGAAIGDSHKRVGVQVLRNDDSLRLIAVKSGDNFKDVWQTFQRSLLDEKLLKRKWDSEKKMAEALTECWKRSWGRWDTERDYLMVFTEHMFPQSADGRRRSADLFFGSKPEPEEFRECPETHSSEDHCTRRWLHGPHAFFGTSIEVSKMSYLHMRWIIRDDEDSVVDEVIIGPARVHDPGGGSQTRSTVLEAKTGNLKAKAHVASFSSKDLYDAFRRKVEEAIHGRGTAGSDSIWDDLEQVWNQDAINSIVAGLMSEVDMQQDAVPHAAPASFDTAVELQHTPIALPVMIIIGIFFSVGVVTTLSWCLCFQDSDESDNGMESELSRRTADITPPYKLYGGPQDLGPADW